MPFNEDNPLECSLSQHPVLKDFTWKSPRDNNKCLNVITYGYGVFYIWDGSESEIRAVNVKNSSGEDDFVILRPKGKPLFDVERILLNGSSTLLALLGPKGVSVLQLPNLREKEVAILSNCVHIGERLFRGELLLLRCAKWHPGSPSDSLLVVMTSDEILRCFDALDGSVLWSCQLSKHSVVPHLNLPNRITLGDTPVHFDFVPPTVANLDDLESVEWPILILWGNGNFFLVYSKLSSEKPTFIGPLLINPPSDDNYGSDASSLIVIPRSPPVVVLSTCSGTVYHCLLMPSEERDNPREKCLCVVEAVELDLGIVLGGYDDVVSCPVSIFPDPVECSRYFCVHAGGIHSITIPLISKLHDFNKEELSEFPVYKTNSVVDYLISTAVGSRSSYECSPLLGVAFVDLTMSLFVLLSSGKLVDVKLLSKTLYSVQNEIEAKEEDDDNNGLLLMIENELKDGGISSQPVIKLPPSTSPQSWLELVLRTSLHLANVLKTHEKVAFQLESRAAGIYRALEDQRSEIASLQQIKTQVQGTAETIAEKYEEMNEKLTTLTRWMENVTRKCHGEGDNLSQKEREASDSLQSYSKNLQRYEEDLERIRATHEYQNSALKKTAAALSDHRAFSIDGIKSRIMRRQLSEFSAELLSLAQRIKDIKQIN